MKRTFISAGAASVLAMIAAAPTMAQENGTAAQDVEVLSTWTYDPLYEEGWSVDEMFDVTDIIDANGEDIGDVENVIFSNDGEVLGIIAEVGGFWDIGDTHVHVPWDEVTVDDGIQQVQVPVTEETVDDYDVFGGAGSMTGSTKRQSRKPIPRQRRSSTTTSSRAPRSSRRRTSSATMPTSPTTSATGMCPTSSCRTEPYPPS